MRSQHRSLDGHASLLEWHVRRPTYMSEAVIGGLMTRGVHGVSLGHSPAASHHVAHAR